MSNRESRSVIVERDIPHPPERIWRALTQPDLIAEWLMKNNFAPIVGHEFNLNGEWGGVLECKVLVVEQWQKLSYTWNHAHSDPAYNLNTVVTFTLTRTAVGTHLHVEQKGFSSTQRQAFGGAVQGWQRIINDLEQLVSRLD